MSTVEQEIAEAEKRIELAQAEAAAIRAALDEFTAAERTAEAKSIERRSKLTAELAAATEKFLTSEGKQDDIPALLAEDLKSLDAEADAREKRLSKLYPKPAKPVSPSQ